MCWAMGGKARRVGCHGADFFKEGRMKLVDPTEPYGKSEGDGAPADLLHFQ
jgi:hypothetical protein